MIYLYPTDTVWGIGAALDSQEGNVELRRLKGSPPDKPLSVLLPDLSALRDLACLPPHLEDAWLAKFFQLESTLALPRAWLRRPLPPWVCGESPFVAFRCLPIFDFALTSTSLNRAGKPPALSLEAAREFAKSSEPPCQVVHPVVGITPSGHSSSMVALQGDTTAVFWRRGRYAPQLESLLQKMEPSDHQ